MRVASSYTNLLQISAKADIPTPSYAGAFDPTCTAAVWTHQREREGAISVPPFRLPSPFPREHAVPLKGGEPCNGSKGKEREEKWGERDMGGDAWQ